VNDDVVVTRDFWVGFTRECSAARFEAEDQLLVHYETDPQPAASGGAAIRVAATGDSGTAVLLFPGETGTYDLFVGYFDENDGVSQLEVRIEGDIVDAWSSDQERGSAAPDDRTRLRRKIASGLPIAHGAQIRLRGTTSETGSEFARFDYIEFRPNDELKIFSIHPPYRIAPIAAGARVYLDRPYTYTDVSTLARERTLLTANADKISTGDDFIRFGVNQRVIVYVGHDTRIASKPAWLAEFRWTGRMLRTTDAVLELYAKQFPPGLVVLGGNGGTAETSMYTVVIEPLTGPIVEDEYRTSSGQVYNTAEFDQGDEIYIDRTYRLVWPSGLDGALYLRTANADKVASDTEFVDLELQDDATLYVAHDDRITPKPPWLAPFAATDAFIVTEDTAARLRLYRRDYPAGRVTLGGNAGSLTSSMYLVIAVPRD
jgi:hypothetical protein